MHIVKKHEQPTRHGAVVGLGWGLAVGVTAALFPPVGIGIAAAGGAGAALAAVAGHASGGMSRADLKDLDDTLDTGQAGLIAVYETNLAEQIVANIKAANRLDYTATNMAADQLADDLEQADADMGRAGRTAVPAQAASSPEAPPTMTATGG